MTQNKSNESIYCGRIVGVMATPDGLPCAVYRVSSRSFPNRTAVVLPDGAAIEPRDKAEALKNPYIAYRCIRFGPDVAVATNGSHTDAIYERMAHGTPPRDAIAMALMAFDYEHDQLDTPRIVAAIRRGDMTGWLGIVRADGIQVEAVPLVPGQVHILATYELDHVGGPGQSGPFSCESGDAIVQGLYHEPVFARLLKPVCGACVLQTADAGGDAGFQVFTGDAPPAAC